MLEELRVAQYRFVVEAGEQGIELPIFKTAALRGGFGQVFKSLVCTYPSLECKHCSLSETCPYPYVFETRPNQDAEIQQSFDNIPRPYILRASLDRQTRFQPGETFVFDLVLIGQAITYAPYFIYAFDRLLETGIGYGRRPGKLLRVEGIDLDTHLSFCIFDGHTKRLIGKEFVYSGQSIMEKAKKLRPQKVTLYFQTPFRTKWQGRYTDRTDFHIIIRSLLRRLSSIFYFHHQIKLNIDFSHIIRKAEAIQIVSDKTRWMDFSRFSARQDTKMNLGGFVGWATYEGDLEPFVPLLLAGELLHASKQAVFGLGQIRCVWG
ncbi:CRISPR-associated protein Cas6 [Collibacillus ludicampi]|uniref:CRISPR-associated protein Cas6 n=1 Tax=Collibacillus ludicampi TaxID=2771369 RepID=A0AAV4LEV1_9BACL|nr:CRISPR system precrRNA processing endoribonuclease RAMP protein Cas6 [Collibacillus ludicampi]GIM46256.1 CRISPR-associated protein Cas6 [Collibacillus ludicampi]